jgi:hypothetical protein
MMFRRLTLGLVSLLAVAAFVVVPAVTQAKPKETKPAIWTGCHGKESKGKCQVVSWGTLTFTFLQKSTGIGTFTCKKSDAGNIWNPAKGNGLDEVVLLDFYECKSEQCPAPVAITALKLPWQTELIRNGNAIFDSIKGIELEFKCGGSSVIATGELTPKMVNNNPTYEEFTAASGLLSSPLGPVEVTGRDKMMGFENQEKIKVK